MGQPETATRSVVSTLSGETSPTDEGLYPCVTQADYDAHIYPRVVLSRELVREPVEVRDEVFLHGWEQHNKYAPLFLRQRGGFGSWVEVARTELGWLVWTTGKHANQTRYVAFESLGHLVEALIEDPQGHRLRAVIHMLVAHRLAPAHWDLLEAQLCRHWEEGFDDADEASKPLRVVDRPLQHRMLSLISKGSSWVARQHRRFQQGSTTDLSTLPVRVPKALYEMKGLPSRDHFWVTVPEHGILPVTSLNGVLSNKHLNFVAYDRANGEMQAWHSAFRDNFPSVTERGGLPDGWRHVSQLAGVTDGSVHLIRTSGEWVVVYTTEWQQPDAGVRVTHQVLVVAAHTVGDLAESYHRWLTPQVGLEGGEVHQQAQEQLVNLCRSMVDMLSPEEAGAETFLSALASRLPAVAFSHQVDLPAT